MKQKSFKIDLKSVGEDGTFEGLASVYGNTDLANEIVEKGAFKRTMDHNGAVVTLLWQHDTKQPIGIGHLEDTDKGLKIKGELNLEVEKGREAHSLLKQKAIKGLSIGYDVIQDKWEEGVRYLKELKLWEVSVVTFPCNQLAEVDSVKSVEDFNGYKEVKDFNTELEAALLDEKKWLLEDAFRRALRKTLEDKELDNASKVGIIEVIFDQYKTAYLSWLERALSAQTEESTVYEMMGVPAKNVQLGDMKKALSTLNESIKNINVLLEQENKSDDSGDSHSDDEDPEVQELDFNDILNQMKGYKSKKPDQPGEIDILKGINLE